MTTLQGRLLRMIDWKEGETQIELVNALLPVLNEDMRVFTEDVVKALDDLGILIAYAEDRGYDLVKLDNKKGYALFRQELEKSRKEAEAYEKQFKRFTFVGDIKELKNFVPTTVLKKENTV